MRLAMQKYNADVDANAILTPLSVVSLLVPCL